MTEKYIPARGDAPRGDKGKCVGRRAPTVHRWQFADWATSCGTEFLSTGPMSWPINPIELRALRRCGDKSRDGEMLLREYSECVFNLANGAFFYDIVDDVEWHYARHLVRPADTNLDEMESDCVRLWNGSDIDCLCLLPLSWGSSGMFERFIKFDRTVEQVNKALTHALYRKFCANRHILEEALFELEVEQLESADMDFPSAYQ